MDLELADRAVFVAGSSRGIGFAIAEAFVEEGAWVILSGRDRESLDRAAAALGEACSERLLAVEADLTDEGGIEHALAAARTRFGALDVIVANVGDGRATSGWEVAHGEWEAVLERNLLGSMDLARLAMPDLIERRGSLVMISSIAGTEAIGAPIAYGAAKAALNSAVVSLARAVSPLGALPDFSHRPSTPAACWSATACRSAPFGSIRWIASRRSAPRLPRSTAITTPTPRAISNSSNNIDPQFQSPDRKAGVSVGTPLQPGAGMALEPAL